MATDMPSRVSWRTRREGRACGRQRAQQVQGQAEGSMKSIAGGEVAVARGFGDLGRFKPG